MATGPADWIGLARRWLRHDEAPAVAPGAAIIDRGLHDLGTRLDRGFTGLARTPRWPAGHPCAVALTHDVDAVDRWTRGHVWHLARHLPERWPREGLRSVARLPWAALRGLWEDVPVARRLEDCVAIEARASVRATYLFFSPERRYRRAFDAWYTPNTTIGRGRRLADLWRELLEMDFELGLHLSIGAHDDATAIAREWSAMKAIVPALMTCRSHYLKRKPGVTEGALATLGGRAELNLVTTGFARGSGLPFVFVDDGEPLYRVPTVLVDTALEATTDGGTRSRIWDGWRAVLDETRRNGSLAVALVHPENPGANEMVSRIIDWARAENAWMPTIAALIEHWRQRSTPRDRGRA